MIIPLTMLLLTSAATPPTRPAGRDLDRMTAPQLRALVTDLQAHVAALESELARTRAELNSARSGKPEPAADGQYPETLEGARALLSDFLKPGADVASMSKMLRPTSSDYEAVFEPATAKKVQAVYDKAWDSNLIVVSPKPGQTRLLLFSASTDDLNKWTGNAAKEFPGGYERLAGRFQRGLTIYRFKFTEPTQPLGMAYDGLVYVNGRWRIFPKPWR